MNVISKVALAAALALGCAGTALAQMAPDDTGAGEKRGIEELNQSGEVGTVTLFGHGPKQTMVVLNVQQAPPHPQPAAIQRARSCNQIQPQIAWPLHDLVAGHSVTIVNASLDRLLSGNYATVVRTSRSAGAAYLNCGHLYR
jgi:hypothetical protein